MSYHVWCFLSPKLSASNVGTCITQIHIVRYLYMMTLVQLLEGIWLNL
jgi:hypothetical protein